MVITYHGEGCFRLQSGETSLLTNPTNNRFKADVTLYTEYAARGKADSMSAEEAEISHAGEYEVKDIEILGIQIPSSSKTKTTRTAYAVRWEEIRFAFFGRIERAPEIDVLDRVGEIDVLFLEVGGAYLPEKEAVTLIKKLSPSIVMPYFGKTANEFLKTIDQKPKPVEKFVFKKKDLVPESQTVVLLEPK